MAELDYAYLADFAQVQEGKISAIGASFTHLSSPILPVMAALSVAGRIRALESESEIPLRIQIISPDPKIRFEVSGALSAGPNIRPYAGKVGILFTFNMQIPLTVEGLYEVFIDVSNERVRRLAFSVETSDGT